MKPFDLQAALAGAPVRTRGGDPVRIAGYNVDALAEQRVIGWLEGGKATGWREDGIFSFTGDPSHLDLVMAPTVETRWFIVPKTGGHTSEATARDALRGLDAGAFLIIPAEVEA